MNGKDEFYDSSNHIQRTLNYLDHMSISEITPDYVLDALKQCCGIKTDHSIDELLEILDLDEYKISPNVDTWTDMDYRKLARYLNPSCTNWTQETIEMAYCYIYDQINSDFRYGWPTKDDPYLLNDCVIYGYCQRYGIEIQRTTSLETMIKLLRIYLSDDLFNIKHYFHNLIDRMDNNRVFLVNMIPKIHEALLINSRHLDVEETIDKLSTIDICHLCHYGGRDSFQYSQIHSRPSPSQSPSFKTSQSLRSSRSARSGGSGGSVKSIGSNQSSKSSQSDRPSHSTHSDRSLKTASPKNDYDMSSCHPEQPTSYSPVSSIDSESESTPVLPSSPSSPPREQSMLSFLSPRSPFSLQDIKSQSLSQKYQSPPPEPEILTLFLSDINLKNVTGNSREGFTYDKLLEAGNNIRRIPEFASTCKVFTPDDIPDLLAFLALRHNIDLTEVDDPVSELKIMLSNSGLRPSNPRVRNLLNEFNPALPRSLYTNTTLRELCSKEGIDISSSVVSRGISGIKNGEYKDLYEALQVAWLLETFTLGIVEPLEYRVSVIECKPIKEIPYNQIVSYGLRGEKQKFFTLDELYNTFNHYRVFQNPASTTNEYFNEYSINKLRNLVQNGNGAIGNEIKEKLVSIIDYIKLILTELSPQMKKLYQVYENGTAELQAKIDICFQLFLFLTMYMRGWKGSGPYPITSAPNEDPIRTDNITYESLETFEASLRQLEDVGDMIYDLPLLRYRERVFSNTTDPEDGLTIRDRIRIVRMGNYTQNSNDEGDTAASCIRITSNLFGATCHRYMTILGLDPGFKMEDFISIG